MSPYIETEVKNTVYTYDGQIKKLISTINHRVQQLRQTGKLSTEALRHLRKYFRIKNIHHSNAIEGNRLDYGETRMVVEEGLTITGKPLKDSLEAKNLAHAMDFFEELAKTTDQPLKPIEIRQIHQAILTDIDTPNAGQYRTIDVQISGSAYKTPSHLKVPKMMDEYLKWLENITILTKTPYDDPIILAAVAHAWFVYIHPFVDGNGRTARIIMNLVLMRYGYPIAIITRDDRHRYYESLEETQASGNLTPFISLLCDAVLESLDEYGRVISERLETSEWATHLIEQIEQEEAKRKNKLYYQFEVWRSAMDLMKGYFKEVSNILNEQSDQISILFQAYDSLDFEKYLSLSQGQTTKRTWFLKIGFLYGNEKVWYLFFFGFASNLIKDSISNNISIHIARETNPFYYQKLDEIVDFPIPHLREIAYDQKEETFVCRHINQLNNQKVETFARNFITEVIDIHFIQNK